MVSGTAFNTSLTDVMRRVVDWTLEHGSPAQRVTESGSDLAQASPQAW